jgi:hypothetical protein
MKRIWFTVLVAACSVGTPTLARIASLSLAPPEIASGKTLGMDTMPRVGSTALSGDPRNPDVNVNFEQNQP